MEKAWQAQRWLSDTGKDLRTFEGGWAAAREFAPASPGGEEGRTEEGQSDAEASAVLSTNMARRMETAAESADMRRDCGKPETWRGGSTMMRPEEARSCSHEIDIRREWKRFALANGKPYPECGFFHPPAARRIIDEPIHIPDLSDDPAAVSEREQPNPDDEIEEPMDYSPIGAEDKARIVELDAMLTVSEEHTQHWQSRAERAEQRVGALEEALKRLMEALLDYRLQQEKAKSVNDGWDTMIAAHALARAALSSGTL